MHKGKRGRPVWGSFLQKTNSRMLDANPKLTLCMTRLSCSVRLYLLPAEAGPAVSVSRSPLCFLAVSPCLPLLIWVRLSMFGRLVFSGLLPNSGLPACPPVRRVLGGIMKAFLFALIPSFSLVSAFFRL